ncbi:hypothetical protein VTN77DRAFT_299 [Rasamsonia byssochlamydoides]|uniref:uncharacterized protein n=1 Tax=Rasamsonia byssochlamydoides TaxID=89139 RepID=UPI0037429951
MTAQCFKRARRTKIRSRNMKTLARDKHPYLASRFHRIRTANGIANLQRFKTVSFHSIDIDGMVLQFAHRPVSEKRRFRRNRCAVDIKIKWHQFDLKTGKIIVVKRRLAVKLEQVSTMTGVPSRNLELVEQALDLLPGFDAGKLSCLPAWWTTARTCSMGN